MKLDVLRPEDILNASGDEVSSPINLTQLCIPNDSLEDLCRIPGFTDSPTIPRDLRSPSPEAFPFSLAVPTSVPTRQRTRRDRRRLNWKSFYDSRPNPVSTDTIEQKAPGRKRRRWKKLHDDERSCMHCDPKDTPQWRSGPKGRRWKRLHDDERSCMHCDTKDTPQWRSGPKGSGTLCNACGIRYFTGRLLPEYRPSGNPSCGNDNYSNKHKKIMNIRKNKAK